LTRLKALNRTTLDILREARESRNPGVALQAIARAEKQLDLECRVLGELKDAGIDLGTSLLEGPEGPQHVKTNSVATGAHTALHSIILRAVIAFLLFPRFPCGFECRAAFALFVQTAKTKADSDLLRVDSDTFFARILCQAALSSNRTVA
jgi:hypothetical protein